MKATSVVGNRKASITIELGHKRQPGSRYQIRTEINRVKQSRGIFADRVRQRTIPKRGDFPWDDLFVSGYGAGRGVAGTGDIVGYSAVDAVYNMFNYLEGMQNPELVLRRLDAEKRSLATELSELIAGVTRTGGIRPTATGIRVDGPWGKGMPLRDLADGYKSTVAWLCDLVGWAFAFKPNIKSLAAISGIVLLDELEQHLHARWKRLIVTDLRRLLPQVQFIGSTHSPLIAASIGPPNKTGADRLYVLEADSDDGVRATRLEPMLGWTLDQVLGSRAFKYQLPTAEAFEDLLRTASGINDIKPDDRTEEQRRLLSEVSELAENAFLDGVSPLERLASSKARIRTRQQIARLLAQLFQEEKP